jgi:ABC-type branched-subunit amino acid transport system substrate-binding protein
MRLIAAAGGIALLAAACASSGSTAGGSDTAAKLTGATVKIGIVQDLGAPGNDHPEGIAGSEAAASYINAHGGFPGNRPVQVISCNAMGSPVASRQCAQEFASDKVIAVGGVAIDFPTSGLPVLQAAGIPFVGLGIAAQDFTNPVSYPVFSPVAAGYPAEVKYFLKQGVKSVAIITIDVPEAIAVADLTLVKPLEAVGIKAVTIPATAGGADMTPYVEQALKAQPQMMVMLQDENDDIRVAQAAAQLGYTGEFAPAGEGTSYDHELSPAAVKKSAVVASTDFATDNPQQQIFVSALNKYQSGTTVNEYSGDEFSEVMTLQTICKSLGAASCTAAGVLSAVKAPHNIPVFMGRTLNVSTPVTFGGAPTHVFNPWIRIDALNPNGTYTDLGGGWIKG